MSKIDNIKAYEILDSRGTPTIKVEVLLQSGVKAYASAPSGASTGVFEALELRDGDAKRYMGRGVLKAVNHVNTRIRKSLIGKDASEQEVLDGLMIELDGSSNKGNLGANAILPVSLALAKATAIDRHQTLYSYMAELIGERIDSFVMPVPLMNIINGGVHADNPLVIQEFMIIPLGAPSFSEALRYGVEITHCLKAHLKSKGLNTSVGDEGGFSPALRSSDEAIECILEAITQAGYQAGKQIFLGLDAASTEFYSKGKYYLENEEMDKEKWLRYLEYLVEKYPILSIEDGMAEADEQGWIHLTQRLGKRIQLVGDDLFVTNPNLFKIGIDKKLANAILIKPNQIGTLTETIRAIHLAKQFNYSTIISHRSGETEDTTIADLSVGVAAGQIKAGSVCRTDRIAKYNRLLSIEIELLERRAKVNYAGMHAFECFFYNSRL